MTTFADLKTRLSDELDRSDLNSQIDRELRRAVEHYERTRFWFNEQQATASTSSSQAAYGLPSDLLVLDDLEVTISNRRLKMNEISWGRYLDEYRYNTVVGQPSDWAYYANQLWLGPVPNGVYVLTLSYLRTLYPSSFSDGTDNAWTNHAYDLLSARVLKTLGARVLGFSTTQLLSYQQLEKEAFESLKCLSDQRLMTGQARPWCG